jgi:hypothetical protein
LADPGEKYEWTLGQCMLAHVILDALMGLIEPKANRDSMREIPAPNEQNARDRRPLMEVTRGVSQALRGFAGKAT